MVRFKNQDETFYLPYRSAAIVLIGNLGSYEGGLKLIPLLDDNKVRVKTIEALGNLKIKEAIEPIRKLTLLSNKIVSETAKKALKELQG